ncbi:MAG: hypothetical protein U1D35_17440, partial [Paracoccaceae bacterium]|nr:hypothetical protein [Paracoccaceae bacterium]
MRLPFALIVASALVACAPTVPESGVGFDDYATYMSQREAALASGGAAPSAPPVFSTGRVEAALDSAEAGTSSSTLPPAGQQPLVATDANRPRGNAPAGIREENGEMARMSDEQNFDAVAARETIASNADRLAGQRAQYQVVAPTALPQRSGPSEPNIVAFALATSHAPGTPVYRRGGL